MKTNLNFLFLLILIGFSSYAQVKIGDNVTSVGASSLLELESTNKALVVARVANTAAITTPVNGMIIYDLSANCLKVYQNGAWSDCMNTSTAAPSVTVVCTGFAGSYCTSALSGTTYVVKITNNDFSSKSVTPLTADLVLSGMTGVTVASVSPSVATTILAGANLTITYTLSGTPSTQGTLTGSFAKLTLSCESTVAVVASKAVTAASSAPTECNNTALTAITHTTSGAAIGIGTATGLPAGVTASWASNTITISGTPTASGTFNYSIPVNGCGTTVNATGTITVTARRTVAAASSTPTVCNNTALTTITHATTVATSIGTATGLPAGVTASWASNSITISGTPTESGTFAYSIPLTGGGCGTVNATGTITVTEVRTVTAASLTPMCINTAQTTITHNTTAATSIGTATGLPAGVTASWASNTITISGTPTASGTFTYSIPLTGGGCGTVNATGTITVTEARTVTAASSTPTICNNTALTTITHTTTAATSIGTATGLPAGVTASWASNTITISGTPTESGTFAYSIPLTGGGCGTVNATGTITVTEARTVTAASSTPTLCNNTALTAITHTTTAATSIGTATGLPAGVTASWASNTITISGTPTASGTFTYSIPLTGGGCGTVNATGTITVSPGPGNYTLAGTAITQTGSTVTGFTANWTGLAGATGYTLEYSTSGSGPWTAFASNPYTGTSAAITGLNAQLYYFRVTSIGGTCAGSQAQQVVSGCSANVGGTSKGFMCYNLGVTGTQDKLSYQSGANNGALYQWGRQTDGHEVRTSLTSPGPKSAPVANRFITNSLTNGGGTYDWRSPQDNTLWLDASKTANDPCPAGFRVPTQAQWGGLFRDGTTSGQPGTATRNTWTWTGNGYTVGANLYLPAAGCRLVGDATLYYVGANGYYTSSTVIGPYAYNLHFVSGYLYPGNTNNNNRGVGFSVRCISE